MARHVPEDVELILRDLEDESDRAVAIVGVSLIEHFVEIAIQAKLSPISTAADRERLFGHNGMCPSFAAKILLAFGLGIVGPKTRSDLDLLRKIRNEFAHNMNQIDLNAQKVGQWVDLLTAHLIDGGAQDCPRREKLRAELYTLVYGLNVSVSDLGAANGYIGA